MRKEYDDEDEIPVSYTHLTPLAFWLHVPSAVPVAYGLAGTPLSAFSAACGVVVYYICLLYTSFPPSASASRPPRCPAEKRSVSSSQQS